ncbi:PQQ-binding-like beta-propeller repeat protein [bacterium]|nr:PQQ-binding-like beta-propeller repeat protein [bacterium]
MEPMVKINRCIWVLMLSVLMFSAGFEYSTYAQGPGNDWPRWRGQNSDGKAPEAGIFKEGYGLKVAWKKTLGSGYSSISIADDRAVTMFSDSTFDYMVALDAKSGRELWRYKIDSTYVGHDGSHNGPISTPLIEDGRVYALGPKGHLFAVDLNDGKQVWTTHIINDHQAVAPFYGFTTSPDINGDVLVVETGGVGSTISGFNKNTGKLLWAAGNDTVNYQSPISVNLAGTNQLLCIGDKYLIGLNPTSGKKLWEFHHNGGKQSINPVMVGMDKIFLHHKGNESVLVQVKEASDGYQVEEVWTSRAFNFSHNTPVHHDGHLYGYSGRFLTCVDSETGKTVWKSRPPGDGFSILVDGHLVIQTKKGTMHVAKATPEGFQEVAATKAFDSLTWTPPSFAYGSIFARNLYEIARVDIERVHEAIAADTREEVKGVLPNSRFASFVKEVERASNKKAKIDDYMAEQKRFPIVEGDDTVHLVYRGDVKDLAISGDFMNVGDEHSMNRVADTDLYYYSVKLEPDAVVAYQFNVDFGRPGADPLNELKATSFNGENGVIYMSGAGDHSHLNDPAGTTVGRIDTFRFESKIMEVDRKVEVYLPPGYDNGNSRYPVVYVNYGQQAKDWGMMTNTLNNLIGKTVTPTIAVFVHLSSLGFNEVAGPPKEKYAQMMAEELVPFIDRKYRTQANAGSRAIMGGSSGGFNAVLTAFRHPGVFAKIAGHSINIDSPRDKELTDLVSNSEKLPVELFLHWGKYDIRNANFSRITVNREFAEVLKEKGYVNHGGEFPDGYGFASWRTRNDDILETFFPLKRTQK